MGTNRAAVLVFALAASAAAGGGAYLAIRDNATVGHPVQAPAAQSGAQMPMAAPVSETEAIVDDVVATPPAVTESPRPPRVEPRPMARPARTSASAGRPTASVARPVESVPSPAPSAPASDPAYPTVISENVTDDATQGESATAEVTPPEPPQKQFDELIVSADSVIGLQLSRAVSSETAKLEEEVAAEVTRDVRVGNEVAIPAGARMLGSVTIAERGGKMKERARLGVRFHTLVLADGTRTDLNTETVIREGSAPSGESAAKIGGGAIGGAILGAILGGGKGAIIGGTAGAGAGTAAVMAGGRNPAELREGSTITVRLVEPVTVTVER